MKTKNFLTVNKRLLILTTLLLLNTTAIGLLGLFNQYTLAESFKSAFSSNMISLHQIKEISDNYAVSIVDASHKFGDGQISRDLYIKEVEEAQSIIRSNWDSLKSQTPNDKDTDFEKVEVKIKTANTEIAKLITLSGYQDNTEFVAYKTSHLYPAIDPVTKALSGMADVQVRNGGTEYLQAKSISDRNMLIMIAMITLSFVIGMTMSRTIIKRLVHQIGGEPEQVMEIAQKIASGDFSSTIDQTALPKNSIMMSISTMQMSLTKLIGQLHFAVEKLAMNATELATTAEQVAVTAEAKAKSATSMSSAIDQLTKDITIVSSSTADVASEAAMSGKLASNGEIVISNTLSVIESVAELVKSSQIHADQLGAKSQEISGVIEVIRDVADQTNLLALNAAIEAARAGEQGRGFAVVADEVRKLSERTAQSTEEIGKIISEMIHSSQLVVKQINQTVEHMAQGIDETHKAKGTVQDISSNVQKMNASISEIFTTLTQQQSASSYICSHIDQIAQMAEETSSSAAQTAKSASAIEQISHELKTAIDSIKL